MASWTDKQRRFVEEYCVDFNATQAAIRAGYSEKTAHVAGSRNMSDPEIAAAVQERLDELAMSAAEATKRTADIARLNAADYFDVDDRGRLYLDVSTVQEAGAEIKKLKIDDDGRVEVEFYDKQRALRDIMDAHGVFNHKQEVEHTGDIDIRGVNFDE